MTVTVTVTPQPGQVPPRVLLDVAVTGGSGTSPISIVRVHEDGSEHRVLTQASPSLSNFDWAGFDYHAPMNEVITYRVTASTQVGTSPPKALMGAHLWLMHPSNPDLSLTPDAIVEVSDLTEAGTSAVHYPFGSTLGVSRSEGARRAASGSLTVRCDSPASLTGLRALLAGSSPILINFPADDDGWWDLKWCWIQPLDITRHNPAGWVFYPYRHVVIPFQVVGTPGVVVPPVWTCADLAAAFATCADAAAAYATCQDMALDLRVP